MPADEPIGGRGIIQSGITVAGNEPRRCYCRSFSTVSKEKRSKGIPLKNEGF
jgi:hypothetical protein